MRKRTRRWVPERCASRAQGRGGKSAVSGRRRRAYRRSISHATRVSTPAAAALMSPPTMKMVNPSWIAVDQLTPVDTFNHGTPIPKMISWPAT